MMENTYFGEGPLDTGQTLVQCLKRETTLREFLLKK